MENKFERFFANFEPCMPVLPMKSGELKISVQNFKAYLLINRIEARL